MKNSDNKDAMWHSYVEEGFLEKIRPTDLIAIESGLPDVNEMDFQAAKQVLQNNLTPQGWTRLAARFRKYKQRKLAQSTTITLHKVTLEKLYALKLYLEVDDYETVFDYLLDPEEDLTDALKILFDSRNSK
ncbi:hypothetical protein J8M20_21975 [Pseudoalteromonas luteoviolacea]|uniref:hypothetical protein n=1 Tax=Pseudoalteromonas luteoviolacea TaxID=43657 RepID=UPI001B36AA08|nr:hypothetical protein [Pseudoalteromonas luteoviolacea]MBQ4814050.1 hypothetical protein [Pseudoalteromonas luteoviolacea]